MTSYTIRVYKDGNAWCALLGPDLQEGLSGWGDMPERALDNLATTIRYWRTYEQRAQGFWVEDLPHPDLEDG